MSQQIKCPAKIRPFVGSGKNEEVELECERGSHGMMHAATLRGFAGEESETIISWEENDRRNFRGDYWRCTSTHCILPGGHPGKHAS